MNLKTTIAAVAFGALACPAIAAEQVGVREITFVAPERGVEVSATIWYPAEAGGAPERVGENGVFIGAAAWRDAPAAGGRHPLILQSHGGFRSAPNSDSWIASRLASDGYVVAALHPPSRGLKAKDALRELWLRPADLSALLTALTDDPAFSGMIDADRVGALGFLLGGTSALALAGARIEAPRLSDFCDGNPDNVDCAWFAKSGVDLGEDAGGKMGGTLADPRIQSVVAVAPEFVDALVPESLSDTGVPVTVVALGPDAHREFWAHSGRFEEIADATPFDVFNACKEGAIEILQADEGDERLCAARTRTRSDIHLSILPLIESAFDKTLRTGG